MVELSGRTDGRAAQDQNQKQKPNTRIKYPVDFFVVVVIGEREKVSGTHSNTDAILVKHKKTKRKDKIRRLQNDR